MSTPAKTMLDDPAFLFARLTKRMNGNAEMQQRVNAHIRAKTGGKHSEVGAFYNNGATADEKAEVLGEVLRAVLPATPDYSLLLGGVAKGQAGAVAEAAPEQAWTQPVEAPKAQPVVEAAPAPAVAPIPAAPVAPQSPQEKLAALIAEMMPAPQVTADIERLIEQRVNQRVDELRKEMIGEYDKLADTLHNAIAAEKRATDEITANVENRLATFVKSLRVVEDEE